MSMAPMFILNMRYLYSCCFDFYQTLFKIEWLMLYHKSKKSTHLLKEKKSNCVMNSKLYFKNANNDCE